MIQELRSILFQLCSLGIMGHWIVFCIYPQDGKCVIFDSLRKMNKEGYKGFLILSMIVSDDTFVYALKVYIKSVVETNGWHTTLTRNTWKTHIAMIGGPSLRKKMAQNCA